MTDRTIDLQAIRERLSKATEGPRSFHGRPGGTLLSVHGPDCLIYLMRRNPADLQETWNRQLADAELAAHSWQDITDLLALADMLVEAMEKAYYARTYWDAKLLIGDALAAAQPAIDAVKGRETDG